MSYDPTLIATGPPSGPDDLLEQATKINQAMSEIAVAIDEVGGNTAFNFARTELTGGMDALDGISGNLLAGGETAIVTVGENPARIYFYVLDSASGATESVPYVIAPDVDAGTKRWILAARVPRRWASISNPTVNNDQTQGVAAGDEWQTGSRIWKCLSETTGSAVWVEWLQLGTGSGNAAAGNHGHADLATTAALGLVAGELASHEGASSPHSGHATTTALTNHTGAAAPHSGHATLTGGKVDQDPANATATPTASKIPIADSGGKLDAWVTGTPDATASTKGKLQLAGQLGGTAASPTVVGLTESGGQALPMGAVADGKFLKRSGTGIVGDNPTLTMPAGTVLRVASAFLNTTFTASVAPPAFADVTGLSVSITPSSTANNILVMVVLSISAVSSSESAAWRLMRGSTEIAPATSVSGYYSCFREFCNNDANTLRHSNFVFLDSPNTISSVTYKVQVTERASGTVVVNRTGADTSGQGYSFRDASSITVMEIKG
jgi:hypothetical protein